MIYSPKYLNRILSIYSDENHDNRAIVEAVNSLMLASGVYRLFTREDFKEFFERLHLLTTHYSIIDSFFRDENLMHIIYRGIIYKLDTEAIFNCIGLMCGTSPKNSEERLYWFQHIQNFVNDAILQALDNKLIIFIKDIEVKTKFINNVENYELIFKNQLKPLTDIDFKNASIFSNSILSDFPDVYFNEWKKNFPDAQQDYDIQAEKFKNTPYFRFWELSDNQVMKIKEHFSGTQTQVPFDVRKMMLLTHLAWAYANNFVYHDDQGFAHVEDFVWLNGDSLCRDEEGYNLDEWNEVYQLEELYPILKMEK